MTNYDFYIAQLRFVATRTARESDEVACSVDALLQLAAGNAAGEKQVRWSIEASMAMMAQLTTHAELTHDAQDLSVTLPPVS